MSAASILLIQYIFHSSVLYLGAYQSQMVTQSEAIRQCSEKVGVASFEYFDSPPGTEHHEPEPQKDVPARLQRLLTVLSIRDGESIWLSGRPVFSDFIDWISCQTSLNPTFYKKFTLPENILYTCWYKCKHTSENFAFNLTDCYCIHVLKSAFCNNNKYKTGIQIYRIINYSVFNRMAPFQCVLRTYTKGNGIKHSTNKCSANYPGICVSRLTDKQTLSCANVTDKDDMCVFNESRTWAENIKRCNTFSGKLMPYFYETAMTFVQPNTSYSLGIFRSFKAVLGETPTNNTMCLSLIRVNGEFWLEPENCTRKLQYLCNGDNTADSVFELSTAYASVLSPFSPNQDMSKEHHNVDINIIVVLALLCCISVVVNIVLTACLCLKHRRMKRAIDKPSDRNVNMYEGLKHNIPAQEYMSVKVTQLDN